MIPHPDDPGQAERSALDAASAEAYIHALLSGGPPNGAPASAFGDYCDIILGLVEAYKAGGTPKVREAWRATIARHPELAKLASRGREASERKTRWTADELLAAEFPPVHWVVPGVLPEGLMFLAGRPKIGKSLLALQLAHAVSSGGTIFDQAVRKVPVLYLAYEDSARRLQKRMQEQAWPAQTWATFELEWAPLDQHGLSDLERDMTQEGYRLVVIDTFSRALSGKPDQNSVGDMTRVLSALQRLALDQQALVQVIDHHHKAQGAPLDPVDDILGSTGKGAVADCVAGLYRERGKKGAILHIVGRDLDDEKRLALEWDKQLSCWAYLGDAEEVANNTLEAKIISILRQLGEATTTQLAELLDEHKGSISRSLKRLFEKNTVIMRAKRGREIPYTLPTWEKKGG